MNKGYQSSLQWHMKRKLRLTMLLKVDLKFFYKKKMELWSQEHTKMEMDGVFR